jgi:hypothetical protein
VKAVGELFTLNKNFTSSALETAMARQCDPILEWREQYARRYLKVDFEPLAGAIFHASVKPIFPELRRPSGAEPRLSLSRR